MGYETLASHVVKTSSRFRVRGRAIWRLNLVPDNSSLDGGLVANGLKGLGPLLHLEHLVNDTLDLDLARLHVVDGSGELVSLREGTEDCNLVTD